ncbi:MAG: hypothetical protein V6Z89_25900 [Desulfobacter sp.]
MMKKVFDAVIGLDGVSGAMILDEEGRSAYDPLRLNKMETGREWMQLIHSDAFPKELDLVFKKGRLYIRELGALYLLVFMAPDSPVASLKLTCDLFEQEPDKPSPRKRFFNLFS